MMDFPLKKVLWKPAALHYPAPAALVSCGTMEAPNILTIAWTGIVNSHPPLVYISVSPLRHSHKLIKESGEFVINATSEPLARAADFCGVRSRRTVDKFREMNLTPAPAEPVSAPMILESPLSLACRVLESREFPSHEMFLAEILACHVRESLIDEDGRLRLEDEGLVSFSHAGYFGLGKHLGHFGFSVRKKKKAALKRK